VKTFGSTAIKTEAINTIKPTVAEQQERARVWAAKEFGSTAKNKAGATTIKPTVAEQQKRARVWAAKEFKNKK